ncbi:MAG: thiol peroxidase [Mucinivorans sp.]
MNTSFVFHDGNSLTLLGETAVVGGYAPDFTAIDTTGKAVRLSDFRGKIVVLSIFPSIDTPVCARQAREFNRRAIDMSQDVEVLALSKDLPFALARFCGAEGLDRIIALSDYRHSEFGFKYGFLIRETMLLARGVVIIDRQGLIAYVEYVADIAREPDYEQALAAVSMILARGPREQDV